MDRHFIQDVFEMACEIQKKWTSPEYALKCSFERNQAIERRLEQEAFDEELENLVRKLKTFKKGV